MSRRTNPWPAFVDLFSALLVAAFAGFILMTSGFKKPETGTGPGPTTPDEVISDIRKEAEKILKDLETKLGEGNLKANYHKCGEDTCLDLYIQFLRSDDQISEDQKGAINKTCNSLREALDRLEQRHDIEVIVEGHTDRTQVRGWGERVDFLYNWELSSKRAASILWEFRDQSCRLKSPEYSITASGYADSRKLCNELTEECDRKNRRTTLRLRANTQVIEQRLRATKNSSGVAR